MTLVERTNEIPSMVFIQKHVFGYTIRTGLYLGLRPSLFPPTSLIRKTEKQRENTSEGTRVERTKSEGNTTDRSRGMKGSGMGFPVHSYQTSRSEGVLPSRVDDPME